MQEQPTAVREMFGATQAGKIPVKVHRRARWAWAQASVWTDRMLAALQYPPIQFHKCTLIEAKAAGRRPIVKWRTAVSIEAAGITRGFPKNRRGGWNSPSSPARLYAAAFAGDAARSFRSRTHRESLPFDRQASPLSGGPVGRHRRPANCRVSIHAQPPPVTRLEFPRTSDNTVRGASSGAAPYRPNATQNATRILRPPRKTVMKYIKL